MEPQIWTGKKVLVVEDSDIIKEMLSDQYTNIGLDVVGQCANGVEAIEEYKKLSPDLVSMDIIMPEMHGIDCYRQLLAIDPKLKCIFLSCLSSHPKVAISFEEEIPSHCFVNKPISLDELSFSLNKVFTSE